jgi:hypothetical protein
MFMFKARPSPTGIMRAAFAKQPLRKATALQEATASQGGVRAPEFAALTRRSTRALWI